MIKHLKLLTSLLVESLLTMIVLAS